MPRKTMLLNILRAVMRIAVRLVLRISGIVRLTSVRPMKVTSQENEFFMFDVWGGSFYDNDREEEHIITPLYLAQLQRDQRMVCILKEAGACDVPSREKTWEEVKTSENCPQWVRYHVATIKETDGRIWI